MNYRQLGTTGISVSEIGFGAWGIGGLTEGANSYGPTDDNESKSALLTAFSRGITFYDTADVYGNDGHSETLIGETFHFSRGEVIIATKGGSTGHRMSHDVSRDYLRSRLEGSLRRLNTDYIDLYQLHSPPLSMMDAGVVETLQIFQTEGKIREFGYSVKNPDDAAAVIAMGFNVIQVNFSMLDQRASKNGLFDLAEEKGIGIINRTPLNFGFLAKDLSHLNFDPHDHRSSWPPTQIEKWASAPDLFSFLNSGKERSRLELALQFCLSFKAISSVIPGMLHPAEAIENARASDLGPLTPEELEIIAQIHGQHTFFESSS